MITIETDAKKGLVVASAIGTVTAEDYETRLVPALVEAVKAHGSLRMLYRFGPDFTAFSSGAMWADMKLGLQHMRDIERMAVVSDHPSISGLAHAFAYLLPMPVRVFADGAMEAAEEWLLADEA